MVQHSTTHKLTLTHAYWNWQRIMQKQTKFKWKQWLSQALFVVSFLWAVEGFELIFFFWFFKRVSKLPNNRNNEMSQAYKMYRHVVVQYTSVEMAFAMLKNYHWINTEYSGATAVCARAHTLITHTYNGAFMIAVDYN